MGMVENPGLGNALYECTACGEEVEEHLMARGDAPHRIGVCKVCSPAGLDPILGATRIRAYAFRTVSFRRSEHADWECGFLLNDGNDRTFLRNNGNDRIVTIAGELIEEVWGEYRDSSFTADIILDFLGGSAQITCTSFIKVPDVACDGAEKDTTEAVHED